MDFLLIFSGALTGFLVGLTGVGGGALMTPLLLLFFGVAPMQAVGTDLWFAAITKIFGGRVHQKHGLVDWYVLRLMWLGSLTSSLLTIIFLKFYPLGDGLVSNLQSIIAIAVLITAIGIFFQKQLHQFGLKIRLTDAEKFKALQPILTVLSSALLGILVTLTSVGAGALGAVLLAYLFPIRLTPPRLIATDIVHAIPLAFFAGIGHLWMGNVDFMLLINLLVGSIPAVIVGARISAKLPHNILRILLGLILMLIASKLLISSFST
jgi:uncharacterized membrane protein YfcA